MTENDETSSGPLRALTHWWRRIVPPSPAATPDRRGLPARIAHYEITGKLGQGGMGIVYAARDEKLGRAVALKTMSSLAGDETARKRFWREARAAASVNHPNVCQLYEIGEAEGELYIAMELLEGESLAERQRRGPMNVSEMLPIGLGILAALSALHGRGIVHRDLKPSNVFLTPHGVKLLDFGLARASDPELMRSLDSLADLTRSGMVVGTPRYMAPEQVGGEELDARSDLFAAGAILFEMLAGRPAFTGGNVVEILHATLHDQPPALAGSPAVAAVDRVIRKALAKRRTDRPASAEEMAAELRSVVGAFVDDTPAVAHTMTRLVVLPFRVLRADPDTDFLAFSLPDAIATSLSGFRSLIVRSSAAAARFAGEAPDLRALATEADVDRVVTGTLMRSGDQLRATAQLVEAPSGTLLTSHSVLSSMGDLFRLQDDIVQRVVEALALPLAGGAASPSPDSPHDAQAYALYLRANELAREYERLPQARELYERCLELDSRFAPAWARLGRCHRVIGKYLEASGDADARAEAALVRALELNPRLSIAHKYYANLEADTGHAQEAMVRLLGEAVRHGNDPELFAGLVHACRYCGLFEPSLAAHREARRLDPNAPTSLEQTLVILGEVEELFALERSDPGSRVVALGLAGRREEAMRLMTELGQAASGIAAFRPWKERILAWLERRPADLLASVSASSALSIGNDPEAIFIVGWILCDAGEIAHGLDHLRRAVARGYFAVPALSGSHAFDALRSDPAFQELLAGAQAGRERARNAFREAGGERLLGR